MEAAGAAGEGAAEGDAEGGGGSGALPCAPKYEGLSWAAADVLPRGVADVPFPPQAAAA
jgi:hypothetical protein